MRVAQGASGRGQFGGRALGGRGGCGGTVRVRDHFAGAGNRRPAGRKEGCREGGAFAQLASQARAARLLRTRAAGGYRRGIAQRAAACARTAACARSEERRVGKGGGSTWRPRW